MKAIIRNYPGSWDDWKPYDSVSYKSYNDLDEAKKQEEPSPLQQVIAMINDSEAAKYKKYLWENRTFRELK
jgi:hypothetical protein